MHVMTRRPEANHPIGVMQPDLQREILHEQPLAAVRYGK
jgi:hypothetical protein